MSERELNNRILWIVISVLILIVVSLSLLLLKTGFKINFSSEWTLPVLTIVGATIGAFITGQIANNIHKKEFKRLRVLDEKESWTVKRILFYYSTNIENYVSDLKNILSDREVVLERSKRKTQSLKDQEEFHNLYSEIIKKIQCIPEKIIKEFEDFDRFPVEKIDLITLENYLLYKTLFRNVAIPMLTRIEEDGTKLTIEQLNEISKINQEFIKELEY